MSRPQGAAATLAGRVWMHRSGRVGGLLVLVMAAVALASALGWMGAAWSQPTDTQWAPPSLAHWAGTNRLGQDIWSRALASTTLAFSLGLVVALASTLLGAALGALAGRYHQRWPDHVIVWLMGVLDSIPFYLFAAALAFALQGLSSAMYVAMIATFWTATARLVRAEVMRLVEREFVLSARAIGLGELTLLVRHVVPNTGHILLVQASLMFVTAIKTEVILSFLGLGVQDGVSWGLMLAESTQDVLMGHFGNFIAASSLLFLLLLGFNLLADALQDLHGLREDAA